MRHGIVEGEPGMFPDPIARLFVAISRFLRRRGRADRGGAEEPPPPEAPGDIKGGDTKGGDTKGDDTKGDGPRP